jgi:hypothetical protein
MTDGVNGRRFFDLAAAEEALTACEGIASAKAYLKYNTATNEMNLYADVKADATFEKATCLSNLGEHLAPNNIPLDINLV